MKRFEGKTVLITGASKGIGRSLATYFRKEGAKVVTISRSEITDMESGIYSIISDVRNCDYIEQILKENNFSIDILINNAGVICYENLDSVSREQIESVFDTNVISTFLLSQMIAKKMTKEKKKGVIVNTLSFAANIPSVGSGIYAASKAALASLTRTMAAEWAPKHIRVNGYSPGVIETDMTQPTIKSNKESMINAIALHEIGSTEQMVKIVGFLASEDSEYMTGVNLDASGGKFIVQNAEKAWMEEKGDE